MPLTAEQKDRWREGFKEVDKDGSGKVSTKELKAFMVALTDDFSDAELKELVKKIIIFDSTFI